METIDVLYDLIKNDNSIKTYKDNQELFTKFYYHEMHLKQSKSKVMFIYKYLLSLNLQEDEAYYTYKNIFDDFNYYEQYLTQNIYIRDAEFSDFYVDKLYELISDYNILSAYAKKYGYNNLVNSNHFIRDYTGAMMILLNKGFFKLSTGNVKKMYSTIKNNPYLQSIMSTNYKDYKLLDKEYLFDYFNRYLVNINLIDDIDNDYLLNAIKSGKIKDKQLLLKIISKTNIAFLDILLDDGLSSFVDILELSFPTLEDRIEVFYSLYQKYLQEEEHLYLLDFIINDKRSKTYLSPKDFKILEERLPANYPLFMDDNEVEYFLNNHTDGLSLLNLKENLKQNNWSYQTRQKVALKTKDVCSLDLKSENVLLLFNLLFNGNKEKLTYLHVVAALKTMIKEYLHDDSVLIYLTCLKKGSYGMAYQEDNVIKLNLGYIKKLFECPNYEENPEALHIIDTIFHEARHLAQYKLRKKSKSEEAYERYKEEILKDLDINYYQKNYIETLEEIDARLTGAKTLATFLEKYYPNMVNCIKYYKELALKEEKRVENKKQILELAAAVTIDEALEKIIAVNPKILLDYPKLQREFNLDGTKIEEIPKHNL